MPLAIAAKRNGTLPTWVLWAGISSACALVLGFRAVVPVRFWLPVISIGLVAVMWTVFVIVFRLLMAFGNSARVEIAKLEVQKAAISLRVDALNAEMKRPGFPGGYLV